MGGHTRLPYGISVGYGCRLPDDGPLFRPLRRVSYEEDENRKQLREGVLG